MLRIDAAALVRRGNALNQVQIQEVAPVEICAPCVTMASILCDMYLTLLQMMRSGTILLRNTHTARSLEPVPLCVWCWARCRAPSGSGTSPSCRGWRSSAADVRRVSPPLSFHPASTGPSRPGTRAQADVVSHPPPGRPAQRCRPLVHWLPVLQMELTALEGKLEEMAKKNGRLFVSCYCYYFNLLHELLKCSNLEYQSWSVSCTGIWTDNSPCSYSSLVLVTSAVKQQVKIFVHMKCQRSTGTVSVAPTKTVGSFSKST